MFESKLAVMINPQMLDKFEERKTTEEMVMKAIEKGYVITMRTPSFLFKYESIIDLLIKTHSTLDVFEKNLSSIMSCESRRKEVTRYYADNFKKLNYKLPTHYFIPYIDAEPKYAEFIQRVLGLEYLKEYPDYVYNPYFDLENYYINDEFLDFLEEIDIDFNRLHKSVSYKLDVLVNRFPRILKAEVFANDLDDYKIRDVILDLIAKKQIGYEDIPEFLINDKMIKALVINEPELYDKFPNLRTKVAKDVEDECIKSFIDGLPDSLKNMETLSFVYPHGIADSDKSKVIDAIKENNFLMNNCNWYFIHDDIDVMMDQIRRNPNVLNTFSKIFEYCRITDDNFKEIMDLIKDNNITLYTMHSFYTVNIDFMKFVLKNNPSILSNTGRHFYDMFSYNKDGIVDLVDEDISPASLGYGEKFDKGIIDAIKMNPYNYYSLYGNHENKPYAFDAYEAYLQSGMELYDDFSRPLFPNHGLEEIERLRTGNDSFALRTFDSYDRTQIFLPMYYVANHPELVDVRTPNYTFYINIATNQNKPYSYYIEVDELKDDFSNYYKLKKDLTEDELLLICDKYYENKDKIMLSESELKSNPYIFINELLSTGKYLYYSYIDLNGAQLKYFNKRFKELNCKINDHNAIYIRDFDIIYNAFLNNQCFGNILCDWMSLQEKEKLNNLIIEKIKDRTILLVDIPVYFIFENYDLLKEYYDVKSIYKKIHYYDDHVLFKDILIDVINNNCIDIRVKNLELLDDDVIRNLLNKNKHLLSSLKRVIKKEDSDLSQRIINIVNEFNYDEMDYDIKEELSKERLESIFENNPTNMNLFKYFLDQNNITEEEYREYYLKCIEAIKNGYYVDGVEFDPNLDVPIDLELICYLTKFDRDLCVKYLEALSLNNHDYVINYLVDNINLFYEKTDICDFLTFDDIELLYSKCSLLYNEVFFNAVFKKFVTIPELSNRLYELWNMSGRPTNKDDYLHNYMIAKDIINSDDFNYKYYDIGGANTTVSVMIYKYYKSKGNLDITSSTMFYTNPLILLDYVGVEIPTPPPLNLDRIERINIYLEIAKNNPSFYVHFGSYLEFDIKKLILEDPVRMMNLMHYPNRFVNDILDALKNMNYKFDENTPMIYLNDVQLLLEMLQDDNDKIDFVISVIEHNGISNRELNDYVSKIVVERGIAKYYKYVSCFDLNDYLIDLINNDFNVINNLVDVNINMNILKYIFTIAVDKIKSGEYVVDENTPKYLFYSDEIRSIVRELDSSLLDDFKLERLDRARDYSLIIETINNPNDVDRLFEGVDRNYPVDLVNQLVEKLINLNYQVNENTPKFLMCNCNFIYHLLKNNVYVSEKYLHNFVTFENYYILKDKELFTKLINKGYGIEFKNYILKFGLDTTLDIASKYGYLLNLIDLSSIRMIDDIPLSLVDYEFCLDIFDRVDDLDNFIKQCIDTKGNFYSISRSLMSKYIKDIERYKDNIIMLIKNGYSLYSEGIVTDIFFNNKELITLFIIIVLMIIILII